MADFPVRETTQLPMHSKRKIRADEDVQRRLGGPIHQERHVRVICVGAGASGLLFAYKIQRNFQNVNLTIYEKNPEVSGLGFLPWWQLMTVKVSGTWYENRYRANIPNGSCRKQKRTDY